MTVTTQVAFLPLWVAAVIVAVPTALAVTTPFASTSTIPSGFTVNVTVPLCPEGIAASSVFCSPMDSFAEDGLRVTFVGAATTVMVTVSAAPPVVVTVIVVLPFFTPCTVPSALTLAILEFLDLYVIAARISPSSPSVAMAFSCSFSPTPTTLRLSVMTTFAGGSVTSTTAVASYHFSST